MFSYLSSICAAVGIYFIVSHATNQGDGASAAAFALLLLWKLDILASILEKKSAAAVGEP